MDYADSIDGYCGLIPEGPTKDACHKAASLLRDACLIARDACNKDCADLGLAGQLELGGE